MRHNLHSMLWIFLVCAVIGMLALDIPMAEAAAERTLRLELPQIDTYPVPGLEVPVNLTIKGGSYTNDDMVDRIQITIEYDSSVARVEKPYIDNIEVYADRFGIEIGEFGPWIVSPSVTPGAGTIEQLQILMTNFGGNPLQEPTDGFPAVLMRITFTVQNLNSGVSTNLEFIDDDLTFFIKRNQDKLLLHEGVNGRIFLQPTESTEVTLSLPSLGVPPVIGEPVEVPLSVEGGYINEDLIDRINITIAYDSAVVDIEHPESPITDIQMHLDRFGITSDWVTLASLRENLVPPEHPELDKQLVIQSLNGNPGPFPDTNSLGEPGRFPEDLLTIKFIVQSGNPQDKTLLFFIDDQHSFFRKRDETPLPVDPKHGDIALPVKLSALGAIWHPNGTKIFWEAISQQGNLGWNIYRAESKDGKFVKINGELIKGAGTTSNPMKYSFIDKDAEKGKIYYYYLEDISFNGEKHRTDPIKSIPVNKIISWGAIKRSALH